MLRLRFFATFSDFLKVIFDLLEIIDFGIIEKLFFWFFFSNMHIINSKYNLSFDNTTGIVVRHSPSHQTVAREFASKPGRCQTHWSKAADSLIIKMDGPDFSK